MSGVDESWDLYDWMNPDCWRKVLDNLPYSKTVVSLATASPDLRSLLDETDELNVALALEALQVIHPKDKNARIQALSSLRHLSLSPKLKSMVDSQLEACISQKFDVDPPACYHFDQRRAERFITRFEDHVRSPFVFPACQFSILSDVTVTLLCRHGRYLRQVKISLENERHGLLHKMSVMLAQLSNIEKLVVYNYYSTFDLAEPFLNNFPPCPNLSHLKLKNINNTAPLRSKLLGAYGPQLSRLSLEPFNLLLPDNSDLNTLAKLQRLEILTSYQVGDDAKFFEALSKVQWLDFKEIHFRLGGNKVYADQMFRNLNLQLNCLQNFRATLEAIRFHVNALTFGEREYQAFQHHDVFPKLEDLSIDQPTIAPVPQLLQKYFAKVFQNLKRLRILRQLGCQCVIPWRYEHVDHYFNLFSSLEEVKIEKEDGVFITYKKKTGPPSSKAHLSFLFENKVEQILQTLREKLEQLRNVESLAVEIPNERENEWVVQPVDLADLPLCPNLKRLDLTLVSCSFHNMQYTERRLLMQPIVSSLLNSYGAQLTELSTGNESFYAEVGLPTWKRMIKIQIFRAYLLEKEWIFAYETLSQVRWPQLNQLCFGRNVPFTLELVRVLGNFKDSLTTLQIGCWAVRYGPRVWIDEQVPRLPKLTKLIVDQIKPRIWDSTETWKSFARLCPNLTRIHFVSSDSDARLNAADVTYFSGLFATVKEIKLVDKRERVLDQWRRENSC